MDFVAVIFGVFGGLALFLYGLRTLSEGLQKIAGDRLKNMLERLTDRPIKGIFVGTFTTGITQSSSIMMVTLIGLINAGLFTLEQAVGVMLGAEIGTTITAQLIAFRIGNFYLPLIAIGFSLYYFSKTSRTRYIGQSMLGFGILFLGMAIMKDGVTPFRSEPFFLDLLANLGRVPVFGIIVGALFTGIIQSSSATTGLVIAMGMENVLTLPSAIALIFWGKYRHMRYWSICLHRVNNLGQKDVGSAVSCQYSRGCSILPIHIEICCHRCNYFP